MISDEQLETLSNGWIAEFSVDPYVLKERNMTFWHELDHLIYSAPRDALRVFEAIAQKQPISWTIEGLAVGPLRTFLMVYPSKFEIELLLMRRQNRSFDDMYLMAAEGL